MRPGLCRLALTAHVNTSAGWPGGGGFVALAVAGITSRDPPLVRVTYLAMELTGRSVIALLNFAVLPTGLVMSLGTE
jgi:hypothetical protein